MDRENMTDSQKIEAILKNQLQHAIVDGIILFMLLINILLCACIWFMK